ncbi:MAG: sugar ABC transporter substrate-binding protein, partial [Anaerolineales bacterium]|nr:sugar ABC transporter substrate-binding protein [Anaerolineales bacterium]
VGIAQVLDEYKATGGDRTIHAVGIDTDPTVMKAIEAGVMDGTIAQNPFGHGYLSLLALKYMAEGYTPVEGGYRIDSGTAFVTKDNLKTFDKDIAAITEQIKGELTSKYLTKAGEAAAEAAPAESEAPAASGDLKLVWYAPAPHPYFEEVQKGVDAFAEEFGIPVEKQIGPDWKQPSQNERLEALMAQGYQYFSVYPADGSGANGLYEELTQNGAKVINFGASTLEPTTASFVVATDVKAAAMQATEELIKAMGGKGNIINVLEVLEDSNTVLRKEGVEEVVAKYPEVKIIQEISGMTSTEEAVDKIGNVLSANIEQVDGLIATGFTTSVGIAQVLDEYKATGGDRTIHAVGIDTDPTVMKAIEAGVMDGTIAQNPFGHGYLSLLALKYMAEGYTPVEGGYRIDSGTAFVTKDNLTTFNDDISAVTEQIKGELTTKYLTK